MATYNGDNYTKQYISRPSEKVEKGEIAGRKRLLLEVKLLDAALQVGDVIMGPFIPANSIVTDAKIVISKSLGATGIFELGTSTDSDAFVVGADAGGQAALKRASELNAGIMPRFAETAQIMAKCTEVMDGTVLDGKIYLEVEYVND